MYIENWSWFCYCVLESAWLIASPVIPYTRRNLNSLLLWLAGRPSISSTDIGLFLSTDSVYHFPVLTSTLLHFPSDQLLSCFHLTRSITYLSLTGDEFTELSTLTFYSRSQLLSEIWFCISFFMFCRNGKSHIGNGYVYFGRESTLRINKYAFSSATWMIRVMVSQRSIPRISLRLTPSTSSIVTIISASVCMDPAFLM